MYYLRYGIQTKFQRNRWWKTETPDRPWSIISADLFDLHGHAYLITVDHYSKWPELAKLDNQSSVHTIQHLKSQFARYGIPDKFISDNGPQFSSDSFKKFAKDYGFTHVTSSPHFPQSNGQAERTVQTVKSLLRKASDSYKALLAYRNTPLEKLGLSPSQLFLVRRLKTDLPTTAVLLKPEPHNSQEVEERIKTKKYQDKLHYDKHAGKELRDLYPGENAIARHDGKWTAATVVEKHASPRSYIVQTQSGRKLRRNRRDIRPTSAKFAQRTATWSRCKQWSRSVFWRKTCRHPVKMSVRQVIRQSMLLRRQRKLLDPEEPFRCRRSFRNSKCDLRVNSVCYGHS